MKHLKPYKLINESNTQYGGDIPDAITIDNVKINLDYELDSDDDYITYTLQIPGDQIGKLANLGIIFNDIDYVELDDSDRIVLYEIQASFSEKKLEEYGVDSTNQLDEDDAYSLIEKKIKFKFDKKYTAKEFVKFCNSLDFYSHDSSAVLKSDEEKTKILSSSAKQKALSQFLGSLTQKDYFLLGRDLKYFSTLPGFKALKNHGVTVEEVVDYCLKAVGLENWQKSKNLNKLNNRTGILD